MSGGDLEFTEILRLAAFLAAVWYSGRFCNVIGMSSIPAEIGIGLLFGPNGLDLIHTFSSDYVPLQLMGFIGVSLIIFESGMHLNINKVMNFDIGGNAIVVAILGTCLPIFLGIGFFTALGFDAYPDGLAAGFSLAPTSVGISLSLLSNAKQLHSHHGQIIISAAFLDDIFSIICLVVLVNLGAGNFDPIDHTVLPLIFAFLFVGFGAVGSIYLTPVLSEFLLKPRTWHSDIQDDTRSLIVKDEIHLTLLFCTYVIFSWIGDFIGSSLLGAFVAGMLFSNVPRSHLLWTRQFKRGVAFLLKLFFAATVAFAIKLDTLFTAEAFWKGLIMAAFPCLLTKLLSGVFVGPERWVVGVAMMARGEFAYLVAEQAHSEEQLSDVGFSIVVWSLLWATILAPLAFSTVLQSFIINQFVSGGEGIGRANRIGGGSFSGESAFVVKLTGEHHMGMMREIVDSLHSQGLDVLQSTTETDGLITTGVFVVVPREAIAYKRSLKHGKSILGLPEKDLNKYKLATDLDDEKLDQIAESLKETINDDNAIVIFEATEKEEAQNNLTHVEIKLIGCSNADILVLTDIIEFLSRDCELEVLVALTGNLKNEMPDGKETILYCQRPTNTTVSDVNGNSELVKTKKLTTKALSNQDVQNIEDKIEIKKKLSTSSVIQARRKKSDRGVITAPRNLSINAIIERKKNENKDDIISAPRERSTASIVMKHPEELEKTIQIVRKNTNRSEAELKTKLVKTSNDEEKNQLTKVDRLDSQPVIVEILSTFTAEQRDFIREGIRNIFSAHRTVKGAALVKMIHKEELLKYITSAEFMEKIENCDEEKKNSDQV